MVVRMIVQIVGKRSTCSSKLMPRYAWTTSLATALVLATTPALAGNPRPRPGTPGTLKMEVPGELVVMSLSNGATVEVDGKVVGTIPLEDSFALLPGTHTIRLYKRGYATLTETFEVPAGGTVELELDLLPFAGVVKVQSNPAGASVKVDGKVLGVTPLDEDIPAGKKVFTVTLPGYVDEVREVDIRAAKEVVLEFRLAPIAEKNTGDTAFYETWWFWTIVGVAGAGTAAAVIGTSGGETTPTPNLTLTIP